MTDTMALNTTGGMPDADDYAVTLAEERFVVDVQVAIHRLLRQSGRKQSDLADLLGVSEARVSQLFGGSARNLTLRTVARIFHVLGSRCRITQDEATAENSASTSPDQRAERLVQPVTASKGATSSDQCSSGPSVLQTERSLRASDVWIGRDRDVFDMLSEDAPFASRMVWVSNRRVVPADENTRADATIRRSDSEARRWAAQDRHAFA